MTEGAGTSGEPLGLLLGKVFEGNGPLIVWAVQCRARGADHEVRWHKGFLQIDARPSSFGLTLGASRSDDLAPSGTLFQTLRKVAPKAALPAVLREPETGAIWLPLVQGRDQAPFAWVQLAPGEPPELRVIDQGGTILARRSTQGSYTKRRPLGQPLPEWGAAAGWQNLLPNLIGSWLRPPVATDQPPSGGEAEGRGAPAPEAPQTALPDYQRAARDRVARRLKTVTKALAKAESQAPAESAEQRLSAAAELLAAHLHLVESGAAAVDLPILTVGEGGTDLLRVTLDPDLSPGQNLSKMFTEAKRLARAREHARTEVAKVAQNVERLAADLRLLRSAALSLASVREILARHRLAAPDAAIGPQGKASRRQVSGTSLPWRAFAVPHPGRKEPITFLVGRSAAGSDELCRQAKSHDWWWHLVNGTGSHVILPARQLTGTASLPPEVLRIGAILALHFSGRRLDFRGEVYHGRRQGIRKRPGMAPGLWQIDRADATIVTYQEQELTELLAREQP